jgi:hypothetical protein
MIRTDIEYDKNRYRMMIQNDRNDDRNDSDKSMCDTRHAC